MALVFPCYPDHDDVGGAMGGGVASPSRVARAAMWSRASTLASHALLIGICFG